MTSTTRAKPASAGVLLLGIALLVSACAPTIGVESPDSPASLRVDRAPFAVVTGTCDGACAHYVSCKPGNPEADRARCLEECPQVFSDADSIMGYESLSCKDAVEYVDGEARKTARP